MVIKMRCSCYRPVRLTNGNYVPCGKCAACQNIRIKHMTDLCTLESTKHKYVMMITLTYNNDCLPLARVVDLGDGVKCLSDDDYIVSTAVCDSIPNSYLPYLCRRDLQLFFKRLRKKLADRYNEKIRFFACGEYGPSKFRPHYHSLIWFESDEVRKVLRKVVRESWPFGFSGALSPKYNCSSYVASYVNSIMHLPCLLSKGDARPFVLHSCDLGFGGLRNRVASSREFGYEKIKTLWFKDNGVVKRVSAVGYLKSRLFIKAPRYDDLSAQFRIDLYTFLRFCRSWYGRDKCNTIRSLCNTLVSDYFVYSDGNVLLHFRILDFFRYLGVDKPLAISFDCLSKKVERILYILKRIENAYLLLDVSVREYIKIVERFASCDELSKLKMFYSELSLCSDDTMLYYYDNIDSFLMLSDVCNQKRSNEYYLNLKLKKKKNNELRGYFKNTL